MLEISLVGGIAFAVLAGALLLLAWLRRIRLRLMRARAARDEAGPVLSERAAASGEPPVTPSAARRLELRLEAVETRLAETLAEGAPEERLRDMAGALVGLIRDKNATLETALAGLDQLRARLRALERIGDVAEARALFEELGARLEGLRADQAVLAAETTERIAQLRARAEAEEAPRLALAEQIAKLYDAREAGLAHVLERLAPLEARLAELAAEQGAARAWQDRREADRLDRAEARLGDLEAARAAWEITLAALRAERSAAEVALDSRLAALENPAADPFAAFSDRLTALASDREATVETVMALLAPLESRLGASEAAFAASGPGAAEEAARAEARAIAEALVLERTALFADRLALIEASLPGPEGIHAARHGLAAVPGLAEDQATDLAAWIATTPPATPPSAGEDGGERTRAADLAAIRNMRRIVSLRPE